MNHETANASARIRLLTPAEHADETEQHGVATLTIGNDEDLPPRAARNAHAQRIDQQFSAGTDGRA